MLMRDQYAVSLFTQGRDEAAFDMLKKASAASENTSVSGLLLRGTYVHLYFRFQRYKEAFETAKRSLEKLRDVGKLSLFVTSDLVNLALHMGDLVEANEWKKKLFEMTPDAQAFPFATGPKLVVVGAGYANRQWIIVAKIQGNQSTRKEGERTDTSKFKYELAAGNVIKVAFNADPSKPPVVETCVIEAPVNHERAAYRIVTLPGAAPAPEMNCWNSVYVRAFASAAPDAEKLEELHQGIYVTPELNYFESQDVINSL